MSRKKRKYQLRKTRIATRSPLNQVVNYHQKLDLQVRVKIMVPDIVLMMESKKLHPLKRRRAGLVLRKPPRLPSHPPILRLLLRRQQNMMERLREVYPLHAMVTNWIKMYPPRWMRK